MVRPAGSIKPGVYTVYAWVFPVRRNNCACYKLADSTGRVIAYVDTRDGMGPRPAPERLSTQLHESGSSVGWIGIVACIVDTNSVSYVTLNGAELSGSAQ